MAIESLEHQQKIVYVGLRRMTDDRNLIIDGFKYWMENHSSQPLNVENIVTSMVGYLGLGGNEKKSFMVALHAASNKMASDLPNVPQGLLDRIGNKPETQTTDFEVENSDVVKKSLPPHCIVTSALLQNFTRLLYKQHNEEFSELIDILVEEEIEDISFAVKDAVKRWADSGLGSLELPESTTEDECKALFHGIYLFFSELIGPMDTDSMQNNALQQTLGLEEVSRFHPRLLL